MAINKINPNNYCNNIVLGLKNIDLRLKYALETWAEKNGKTIVYAKRPIELLSVMLPVAVIIDEEFLSLDGWAEYQDLHKQIIKDSEFSMPSLDGDGSYIYARNYLYLDSGLGLKEEEIIARLFINKDSLHKKLNRNAIFYPETVKVELDKIKINSEGILYMLTACGFLPDVNHLIPDGFTLC